MVDRGPWDGFRAEDVWCSLPVILKHQLLCVSPKPPDDGAAFSRQRLQPEANNAVHADHYVSVEN
jgi:hypothetical protein